LNITPVNNDGGELYAPFSLLKQTVNNLEAYGLRPRTKAPVNMYGTTVAPSTNSTIDGRPQQSSDLAKAYAELNSHLNTNLNNTTPLGFAAPPLSDDCTGLSEITKNSINRLGIYLPSQNHARAVRNEALSQTISPLASAQLKSQISSTVRSRRYKKD
jgi:hypothetical protein